MVTARIAHDDTYKTVPGTKQAFNKRQSSVLFKTSLIENALGVSCPIQLPFVILRLSLSKALVHSPPPPPFAMLSG